MPLGGEPADVVARIEEYDHWLRSSPDIPKLLLTFTPGAGTMMNADIIAWCAANIAALEIEHTDAVAGHHAPEDQPEVIAAAISAWVERHGLHR
jgi:haloalkane dehalogenase